MTLISPKKISIYVDYLISYANPGFEFELALWYKLLSKYNQEILGKEVINKHSQRYHILSIINGIDTTELSDKLKVNGFDSEEICLATQDDTVGPSDLVVISSNKKLGISVKYANNCSTNISGRYFLSNSTTQELEQQLDTYCINFIEDMTDRYGDASNWFRKRKRSEVTDAYIDLIRTSIIDTWDNKSEQEKSVLLRQLFQENSPFKYWIVTFYSLDSKFSLDINTEPKVWYNTQSIELKKYQTSYIGFYLNGNQIAKLQVKFNNGILERSKEKSPKYVVDDINMKKGDPFGSWNFSVNYKNI